MERYNCTFETVKILPGNIGYVKLNEFPEPSVCQDNVTATMQAIRNVDAVILDLRWNGGGNPHMVSLIATYFFDRPTHLNDIYDRSANSTEEFWTGAAVPGNNLAHKPLYILTSRDTFSGAEEFCYDMKNLKRATIIGEVTGGGAHLVRPQRIDDHFTFNLPFARPINPVSKTDWEGTGVAPDMQVDRSDALGIAENLAQSKLRSH
jgi:retinol-binding protein 3